MTTLPFRRLALVLAFGAAPVLAGCGDDDADVEDTAPASTAEELDSEALRVVEADLGRSIDASGRVNDDAETDDFDPSDTIYLSVSTEGTRRGTLTARWTFEDGQVVDETSQSISPTGASITEFHISKPDGFPAGRYRVEILLDGQVVESKDFEVSGV